MVITNSVDESEIDKATEAELEFYRTQNRETDRSGFYVVLGMAEGEGFEPPVRLPVRLISSQVPLTTQPPFQREPYYGAIRKPEQENRLKPRMDANGR